MHRSTFITHESRCGQPAADFFRWPLSIRQDVIRTVCTPGLRHLLTDMLERTNGLLVATMAERIAITLRQLETSERILSAKRDHPTSFGTFVPADLPSVRAALKIVQSIAAALEMEDA